MEMEMETDLERKMKLSKSKSTSRSQFSGRLRRKELEYVCVICKVHLRNIRDISKHMSGHLDFLRPGRAEEVDEDQNLEIGTGRVEEADEFHNLEIGNKQVRAEYQCSLCEQHFATSGYLANHVHAHLLSLELELKQDEDDNSKIGNKEERFEYQCSVCSRRITTPMGLAHHKTCLHRGSFDTRHVKKEDEDDDSKIGYGHKDEEDDNEDEYDDKEEGKKVCITDDSLAHASCSQAETAVEDFKNQRADIALGSSQKVTNDLHNFKELFDIIEKKVKEFDINTTFSLVGVDLLHKFVEGKSPEVPVLPHFAQEFFRNAEMSRGLPSSENLGLQVRDVGEVGNVKGERNDLTEMVRKLEEKVKELDIKTTLSLMGVDYLHKFVNGKSPEEPDVSHLAQELYMIGRRRCYGN